MTRIWDVVAVAVLLVGLVAGCSQAQNSAGATGRTASTVAFVQCITNGKFAEATKSLDSAVAQSMSADQLKQA